MRDALVTRSTRKSAMRNEKSAMGAVRRAREIFNTGSLIPISVGPYWFGEDDRIPGCIFFDFLAALAICFVRPVRYMKTDGARGPGGDPNEARFAGIAHKFIWACVFRRGDR